VEAGWADIVLGLAIDTVNELVALGRILFDTTNKLILLFFYLSSHI
jgi:hypothetical protein